MLPSKHQGLTFKYLGLWFFFFSPQQEEGIRKPTREEHPLSTAITQQTAFKGNQRRGSHHDEVLNEINEGALQA